MLEAVYWPQSCREQLLLFPDDFEILQRKDIRTHFMKDGNNGSYLLKNTSWHLSPTQRGTGHLLCAFVRSADNPGEYYTEEKWKDSMCNSDCNGRSTQPLSGSNTELQN